jgi:DNA-binding PucR family transcriptional regulator
MNLHRNSVIYRLDRMEKMLNGSFNDPKFRFDLLISLKILQYIERKNK